ncbi:MAG: hypothetical protein LQ337_005242 [Flavoplaca oasis]|nr:MAG: hypothetical protein LQ337_005242 [Flavoplaca oasis]
MRDGQRPAAAAARFSNDRLPTDVGLRTRRRFQGARPPYRNHTWASIQLGRRQSLDELIQEARKTSRFHAGSSAPAEHVRYPAIKEERSPRKRAAGFFDSDESNERDSYGAREIPTFKRYRVAGSAEPSVDRSITASQELLGNWRMIRGSPYLPAGVRRPILPPIDIRKARQQYVHQLADFGEVKFDIVANAFAIPSRPCDNVGCNELHLGEDCTLALMCTGCCQLGHVSHECGVRHETKERGVSKAAKTIEASAAAYRVT